MIHFGIDPAWGDGIDINGGSKFNGKIMSEIDKGGFGGVIGDAGWEERVDAVGARDIDDFAASLLLHDATDDLASEEWTDKIGGKSLLPIFGGVVGELFVDSDAGVVDEDVDFTESGEGLLNEGFDVGFLADVGRDDNGVNMILGFERRFEGIGLINRIMAIDD